MSFPSDDERFQQVFDLHHGAVQRYCFRRLSPDCANDAVAEVFLVAWRRLDAVPEPIEALPWLYGVARNVVRHFLRGRQRYRNLVVQAAAAMDPPIVLGPAAQVIRNEEQARVVAALDELRESEREVVRLKLWEELSHSEIGEAMGVSPHAVDMRYHRALKHLANILDGLDRPRLTLVPRVSGGGE